MFENYNVSKILTRREEKIFFQSLCMKIWVCPKNNFILKLQTIFRVYLFRLNFSTIFEDVFFFYFSRFDGKWNGAETR